MEYKGKLYGKCGSMLIPLPTDEEIYNAGNEHYIFGKNDPIGSRHRSIYESRRESFILGAIWMRDLIRKGGW